MKNKQIFPIVVMLLLSLAVVSAEDKVTVVPDGMTFEQFKDLIIQANSDNTLAGGASSTFRMCERTCSDFTFRGDCNACLSGETASSCTVHADSQSSAKTWSSGSAYCNDWAKPYNYYNKQCYCSVPTPQCSGGYDPGERKCSGDSVMECSDSGSWEFVESCDYGCSGGDCESNPCESHAEQRCSGSDVYWYDSCGDREGIAVDCSSDEICQNAECVRQCTPGYIGAPTCNGNNVVQQYQKSDCSTEEQIVNACGGSNVCENGLCIDNTCSCGDPTLWSSCINGKMTRTNYKCDASNSYSCQPTTETQDCECGVDTQCDDTEYCSNFVCAELQCEEGQVASEHECVDQKGVGLLWVVYILVPIAIGVGIVIYLKRRKKR